MKFASLLFSFSLVAASCSAQVLTLTGFGTGQFTVVNEFSADITPTQSATTLTIAGNDLSSALAGTFSQFDMTGYMGGVDLTAAITGTNPGTAFTLTLYDSANNPAAFSGAWSSFGSSSSTVTLSPVFPVGPFLTDQVVALQLTFGGAGAAFNITLDALTVGAAAIPEPSTYVLIAMGLGLVGLAIRRRAQRF